MNRHLMLAAFFFASASAAWMVAKQDAYASKKAAPPTRPAAPLPRATFGSDPEIQAAVDCVSLASDLRSQTRSTVELSRILQEDDLEKWIRGNLFKHEDSEIQMLFYRAIYARLAGLNPERFYQIPNTNPVYDSTENLQNWANADHQAVLALANRTFDDPKKSKFRNAAYAAMAVADPKAVLEALAKDPELKSVGWNLYLLAARQNSQMVLEWAENQSNDRRESARNATAQILFERDFKSAMDWAQSQPDAESLVQIGIHGMRLSPDEIGRKLEGFNQRLKLLAIGQMAVSGAHADEWLAFDFIKAGFTEAHAATLKIKIVSKTIRSDPEKALAAIAALEGFDDPAHFTLKRSMTTEFEYFGGSIQARWFAMLTDSEQSQISEINHLSHRQIVDIAIPPDVAIRSLADKTPAKRGFMNRWSDSDVDKAIHAVRLLPDENLKIFMNAVNELLPEKLEAVILLEASNRKISSPAYKYLDLAYRWTKKDPLKAGMWSQSLPSGPIRSATIQAIATRWNLTDPIGALEWVENLSEEDRTAGKKALDPQ